MLENIEYTCKGEVIYAEKNCLLAFICGTFENIASFSRHIDWRSLVRHPVKYNCCSNRSHFGYDNTPVIETPYAILLTALMDDLDF